MLVNPLGDPLTEVVVQQHPAQVTVGSVNDGNRVDQPLKTHMRRTEQAHDHAGRHRVPDPAAHKHISTTTVVGNGRRLGSCAIASEFVLQLVRHAFIGIEVEHPGMFERNLLKRPILMGRPIVEAALDNPRAHFLGNLHRVGRC